MYIVHTTHTSSEFCGSKIFHGPVVDPCGSPFEKFGPDRCMFESNFPVDKDCISYRTLWNLFKKMATKLGLSESEKMSVFSGFNGR